MNFFKKYLGQILVIVGLTIVTLGIYWIVKKRK